MGGGRGWRRITKTLSPLSALFFFNAGGEKKKKEKKIYNAVMWLSSSRPSLKAILFSFRREGKQQQARGAAVGVRSEALCPSRGLLGAGAAAQAPPPPGRGHGHAGSASRGVREGRFSAGLRAASLSPPGCRAPSTPSCGMPCGQGGTAAAASPPELPLR